MVYNGLFLYNACLLGTVIPSLYEPLYGGTNDVNMWIMLIVISSMRLGHYLMYRESLKGGPQVV